MYKVLAINPGSTSTKISVAHDNELLFVEDIKHSKEDLKHFEKVSDQYEFRKQHILQELEKRGIPLDFDATVGRGGLAKAVPSGVFRVSEEMIEDQKQAVHQHACDLGCMLAYEIAELIPNCQSFIADPGVVDEMAPEAHVSGLPEAPRICIWHALNQKAIARRYARDINSEYDKLNLIICHLGGGISIAAHEKGKAIDANNALDGEGPFSPERSGTLPLSELVHLCYNTDLTEEEMLRKLSARSGVLAHLGTNDMRIVEQRINEGDEHAKAILDAMVWHIAKAIVSEGAVLCGKVDAILLTGGLCYSEYIVGLLKKRIEFLAPVKVYPGQDEMLALTENAVAALSGQQEIKEY
ncbi:butyrate kinase [Prevotella sp. HUN102]|uniref:butyrate kinase n=1 Tax=Prevotella sp. HUN102 TaxID=1392486 RepID=UPI00048F0C48|nr:butyrate kinase [Prevotella sp. HUN102]